MVPALFVLRYLRYRRRAAPRAAPRAALYTILRARYTQPFSTYSCTAGTSTLPQWSHITRTGTHLHARTLLST